jgi:hypothetical protein
VSAARNPKNGAVVKVQTELISIEGGRRHDQS